jgi:hypothetical protein
MIELFNALKERIPTNASRGRRQVIEAVVAAGLQFSEGRAAIAKRDDLTVKGKAGLYANLVKQAGVAVRKAERQLAHHDKRVADYEAHVRTKAIGPAKDTDAEARQWLRSLPASERRALLLSNGTVRAAALREPTLSGLDDQTLAASLKLAIEANASEDAALLEAAKEIRDLHRMAVNALWSELPKAPMRVDPDGKVRTPSLQEVRNFIAENVNEPHANAILQDHAELDAA